MATTIPNGQKAVITGFGGLLADGVTSAPLSSLVATLDDYTDAYIALTAGSLLVIPRPGAIPAGQSRTLNVIFSGASQDGTSLPSVTESFVAVGPAAPAQAASINPGTITLNAIQPGLEPGDPGSGVVTLV